MTHEICTLIERLSNTEAIHMLNHGYVWDGEAWRDNPGLAARVLETECFTPRGDEVNHPSHYSHPSGVECITIVEHMTLCVGSAIQYLWRAGRKGGEKNRLTDLKKAAWYIDREISRLEKESEGKT